VGGIALPLRHFVLEVFLSILLDEAEPLFRSLRPCGSILYTHRRSVVWYVPWLKCKDNL
jgi:hypothetical protein